MRTFLILLFILFLIVQISYSQWNQQSCPTINRLYSVTFIDENDGWAVGDSGTVLRTSDGGENWIQLAGGTSNYFSGVFFRSLTEGWIVGGNYPGYTGLIYHTNNSGIDWEIQADSLHKQLNSVCFTSDSTGWAVGELNQVYHTFDNGKRWDLSTVDAASYRSVYFLNQNIGWAAGGDPSNTLSKLIKTTDGGLNWISIEVPTSIYFRSVYFTSEDTGWVGGNSGVLFKTIDGGENWESAGINSTSNIYSINFVNSNCGWLVCGNGLIFHTDDGGNIWNSQTSGTTNYLRSIFFKDAQNGWAVGDHGTILSTTNGGVSDIEGERKDISPSKFVLFQNCPNPFNPATTIGFTLPNSEFTTLKVFNCLGQNVETLVSKKLDQGNHTYTFDGKKLASGIYYYQLVAGEYREVKKMVLIK